MERKMNQSRWVFITLALSLTLIVGGCGTIAPTTTSPAASPTTSQPTLTSTPAPRIPATHIGRTTCFKCHQAGMDSPKFPDYHSFFQDSLQSCQKCHAGP